MREGAYDFVEKPLKRMTIVKSVRKAAERQSLLAENRSLRQELQAADARARSSVRARRCAACSTSRRRPRRRARRCWCSARAAPARSCSRATSTSKSARARGPFVAVNCAAIPESDPRGRAVRPRARRVHRRGRAPRRPLRARRAAARCSSTRSASSRRTVQVKLLRVLQEGEYEPLGGDTVQGRRPHRRRDQPRPARRGRGRPLPRGPLLPPQRHRDHRAAAARAPRRHPAARRSLPRRLLQEERPRRASTSPRDGAAKLLSTTRGRATCASSRT